MAVYTVHQPPLKKFEGAPDPERFAFVREGFSFWAFLFGPLWMLRHRMWLVLLGYIVCMAALSSILHFAGVSGGAAMFTSFLVALLIGMEASTLRRFTLRRWKNVGVVVGDDIESAERRFFDSFTHSETVTPPSAAASAPVSFLYPQGQPGAAAAPGVIGLFPQPGAPR